MHAPPIAPNGPHRMAERVVRPRRNLRAGATQVISMAAGLALGLALPRIEGKWQVDSTRASEVLVGIGLALLGVTSVIFSLLFLVVQWAAGNFTPRLTLFRADPMVWRTFAFVLGLLVYTTSATLAIGAKPTVSVAVPVLTLVLTVVALGLVRNLQLRAFDSIQLAHVLATTTERAHKVIDAFYPGPGRDARPRDPGPLPAVRATVSWPGSTTTVQQLDILRLVAAAAKAGAVVVMKVPIGAVVQPGTAIAEIRGGELDQREVVAALVVGQERTFHQDPVFAFRLLADIGLRALSPAVNDPATAVQVLDFMEGLLGRLVGTSAAGRWVTDDRQDVRVVLLLATWTDFVHIGLDDLFAASTRSPMVLIRARRLLLGLLAAADEPRRPPLAARLAWIERELSDRYPLFWQETTAGESPA